MPKRGDPWFKFYPQDWMAGTRSMTLEQRGAYMDCLCILHSFDRPIVDGDWKWLGHQLHVSSRKAKALIEQLIQLQKLIRTNHGIDNERSRKARLARHDDRKRKQEAALKRERKVRETSVKKSRKQNENSKNINKINDPPAQGVTLRQNQSQISIIDSEILPLPLSNKTNSDSSSTAYMNDCGISFEMFWAKYPRKQGKQAAIKTWNKMKGDEKTAAFKSIKAYSKSVSDPQYLKHGSTYLNAKVWEDDLTPAKIESREKKPWE